MWIEKQLSEFEQFGVAILRKNSNIKKKIRGIEILREKNKRNWNIKGKKERIKSQICQLIQKANPFRPDAPSQCGWERKRITSELKYKLNLKCKFLILESVNIICHFVFENV